jgi:hypothetical protein
MSLGRNPHSATAQTHHETSIWLRFEVFVSSISALLFNGSNIRNFLADE